MKLGISGRLAAYFKENQITPLLALVGFLLGLFLSCKSLLINFLYTIRHASNCFYAKQTVRNPFGHAPSTPTG